MLAFWNPGIRNVYFWNILQWNCQLVRADWELLGRTRVPYYLQVWNSMFNDNILPIFWVYGWNRWVYRKSDFALFEYESSWTPPLAFKQGWTWHLMLRNVRISVRHRMNNCAHSALLVVFISYSIQFSHVNVTQIDVISHLKVFLKYPVWKRKNMVPLFATKRKYWFTNFQLIIKTSLLYTKKV